MAIKVETVSTCDRCGVIDKRPGAHGQESPMHWARLSIIFAGTDRLGQRVSNTHDRILCHECGVAVKDFAYQAPVGSCS